MISDHLPVAPLKNTFFPKFFLALLPFSIPNGNGWNKYTKNANWNNMLKNTIADPGDQTADLSLLSLIKIIVNISLPQQEMFLRFSLAKKKVPDTSVPFMQMRTNESVIAQSFFISCLMSDLPVPLPFTKTLLHPTHNF